MRHELAICGAGPVGLALAALLVQQGVAAASLLLIDGKTLEQSVRDPRSIALSHGSRQILQGIGAWPIANTEIHQIHVSRRGHFGRTLIDRSAHGVPALGYVCEYGAIVAALARVCQNMGIATLRPAHLSATEEQPEQLQLHLTPSPQAGQSDTVTTRLLVQAEGGLFDSQADKGLRRDYQQSALVAHVRTSAPLPQRAFERFTDEGPLALLPQDDTQGHGYALVWCVAPERAAALLALDDAAFLAELGHAFGTRLGQFTHSGPRRAFPLGLNASPTRDLPPDARSVAIGNAAQTLHPVAGQGLNLGLRDAYVLSRLLAQHMGPASLQRFVKARREDRSLTLNLTDTMARVFTRKQVRPLDNLLQGALGAGLGLLDGFDPAKHVLAELMMFGHRNSS
jgi:2-octaprenyl-6-methoxyphenol hydroxylase